MADFRPRGSPSPALPQSAQHRHGRHGSCQRHANGRPVAYGPAARPPRHHAHYPTPSAPHPSAPHPSAQSGYRRRAGYPSAHSRHRQAGHPSAHSRHPQAGHPSAHRRAQPRHRRVYRPSAHRRAQDCRDPAAPPNQPAPELRLAFALPSRPRNVVPHDPRHGPQASLPPRSPPPLAVASATSRRISRIRSSVGRLAVPDAFLSASGAAHWPPPRPG